jgi:hypothetical protein
MLASINPKIKTDVIQKLEEEEEELTRLYEEDPHLELIRRDTLRVPLFGPYTTPPSPKTMAHAHNSLFLVQTCAHIALYTFEQKTSSLDELDIISALSIKLFLDNLLKKMNAERHSHLSCLTPMKLEA